MGAGVALMGPTVPCGLWSVKAMIIQNSACISEEIFKDFPLNTQERSGSDRQTDKDKA